MYYDEESRALSFFAGMLLGVVVGASVALLAAPQPGKKTRRQLAKAVGNARGTAEDQWEELADDVRSAVKAGRKRIRL
jgi:gas vesicle protein